MLGTGKPEVSCEKLRNDRKSIIVIRYDDWVLECKW